MRVSGVKGVFRSVMPSVLNSPLPAEDALGLLLDE